MSNIYSVHVSLQMAQALQKWKLWSFVLNHVHCINYCFADDTSPMFNNSSEIHKGSISWHQQCHKHDAHYTGYQLIIALFIFLKPKPPLHTHDSQRRKCTDTLEQNFTKEIRYQWKGREERKDLPLCLTCQPTELSASSQINPLTFCLLPTGNQRRWHLSGPASTAGWWSWGSHRYLDVYAPSNQ